MKNKQKLYKIISFFLPILLFLCLLKIYSIYPFGDSLINKYDSFEQYPSIIMEFINKIKEHHSLFYTLNGGLGNDFYSIFTYYLASPFNILFLFTNGFEQVYRVFILIIILKIGLSGFTMYTYLDNHFNKNEKAKLLFSFIYALNSYTMARCYNIMWLDAIYLAPLVLFGIDKIIQNKKSLLYILFLTLAIFINYYLGYMLCIFSAIYFLWQILISKKRKEDKKQVLLIFTFSSVFCGLLSSIVLIPAGFQILGNRVLKSNSFSFNIENLKSLFYNFLPFSFIKSDTFNNGTVMVGSTVFVLVLDIFYFFNEKVTKKEKIATFILLFFFFLSFILAPLDYAWQMFSKPIWWNTRYSFLFIAFLIIIGVKSFIYRKNIKINKWIYLVIYVLFLSMFTISMMLKWYGKNPTDINLIFFVIGTLFFSIYYFLLPKKIKYKNIILLVLIVLEIFYNSSYILRNSYMSLQSKTKTDYETSYKINKIKQLDSSFYRIYNVDSRDNEDEGLYHNYHALTIFSSIYNSNVNQFYNQNLFVNDVKKENMNHTKISNPSIEDLSLLNSKYILSTIYQKNLKEIEKGVYYNKYYLATAFLLNKTEKENVALKNFDAQTSIENIYSYLYGSKVKLYNKQEGEFKRNKKSLDVHEYFKLYTNKNKRVDYEFVSSIDGILSPKVKKYFYNENTEIFINNKKINKEIIIKVKKKDRVRISYKLNKDYQNISGVEDLKVQVLDEKKLMEVTRFINSRKVEIQEDQKHIVNAKVNLSSQEKLFITLPYSKGLKAYVDGKKVKINKEWNTFLSINLSKGKHTIIIDYIPEGFLLGIIITGLTLLGLVTYIAIKKWKKLEIKEK